MMSIWAKLYQTEGREHVYLGAKLYPRGGREHDVYLGKAGHEGREGA